MIRIICALALFLMACEVDPPVCPDHGSSCSCCLDRTMGGGCESWSGCRSCDIYCELGFHTLVGEDAAPADAHAADASCEPQDASSDAVCSEPDLGLDLAPDQGVQGLQEPVDHQMRH